MKFTVNLNSMGYIYLPQDLRKMLGGKGKIPALANAKTLVLISKGTNLNLVKRSLQVLMQDIDLRIETEKPNTEVVMALLPSSKLSVELEGTLENGKLTFVCGEKKLETKTGNIKALLDKHGINEIAKQFSIVLTQHDFPKLPSKIILSELEKLARKVK